MIFNHRKSKMKLNFYKQLLVGLLFVILIFAAIPFKGLISKPQPELKLDNPRNTIEVFLYYMHEKTYNPEIASKTIYSHGLSRREATNKIIKLKKYIDAKGIWIDPEDFPTSHNYFDSASSSHTFIISRSLPQIWLKKYGNKWLFSAYTSEQIDSLYQSKFPVDIEIFRNDLPILFQAKLFGIELIKLIGLLLIIVLFYFAYKIIVRIVNQFFLLIIRKTYAAHADEIIIRKFSVPISLIICLLFAETFLPFLHLPAKMMIVLIWIVKAAIPTFWTLVLMRFVDIFLVGFERLMQKRQVRFNDKLLPFLKTILKILIIIGGIFYLLRSFEVEITPLLAGVSIGGLAIALAAQETIRNLFGSVTFYTDKPFEIGDHIKFDNFEGIVEEIGLRSTRIRTFYNSLVSIPNGKLAELTIDNMGKREYRRFNTQLSITYDTPPELADTFIKGLEKLVLGHPFTLKSEYRIHMFDFSDSALQIMFYIFFDVEDWTQELKARHEIMLDIIRLANHLGIRFAFPTRTLHMETYPGLQSLTPVYNMNNEKLNQKLEEFFFIKNKDEQLGSND